MARNSIRGTLKKSLGNLLKGEGAFVQGKEAEHWADAVTFYFQSIYQGLAHLAESIGVPQREISQANRQYNKALRTKDFREAVDIYTQSIRYLQKKLQSSLENRTIS